MRLLRGSAAFSLVVALSLPAFADELSVVLLPGARAEYEGTGFREVPNGWELKVKPRNNAFAVRWRHDFSPDLAFQLRYWRNSPDYHSEDGNTLSGPLRQVEQTRWTIQRWAMDLRRPLAGSPIEVVLGTDGVYEEFHRKDIVFNQVPQAGTVLETLTGLGGYIGFHAGHTPAARGFFWDGEATLGHIFWSNNNQRTGSGSIHQDGYTYHLRLEGGYQRNRWRYSVGYFREMIELMVPGGKALPGGAAASLPINKTDFFSPMLAVTYVY